MQVKRHSNHAGAKRLITGQQMDDKGKYKDQPLGRPTIHHRRQLSPAGPAASMLLLLLLLRVEYDEDASARTAAVGDQSKTNDTPVSLPGASAAQTYRVVRKRKSTFDAAGG